MTTTNSTLNSELKSRLRPLGLYGLLARWDEVRELPWLHELLSIEEAERQRRSLARRLRDSRIGAFKPITDFDWNWPRKIDRQAHRGTVRPRLHGRRHQRHSRRTQRRRQDHDPPEPRSPHARPGGHTVRVTSASDMLADLAGQESSAALARRLRRYILPKLLCVEEVGYLSYSNRYADLLFEVVTRRYDAQKPVLISTNKAFSDWSEVFPHAACTVTLVDRLVHRSEIFEVEGDSYRLKEA